MKACILLDIIVVLSWFLGYICRILRRVEDCSQEEWFQFTFGLGDQEFDLLYNFQSFLPRFGKDYRIFVLPGLNCFHCKPFLHVDYAGSATSSKYMRISEWLKN